MGQKVIIIGSQGYLGSRLAEYLNEHGHECTGMDTGFFKSGIFQPIDNTHTISKDARNIEDKDIKGFDTLILLAGISNDPFGHMTAEQIYDPTREYALKIARMCKKLGIKFIFPSSCSVYGAALSNDYLNEEAPTNPQTHYSINKLQIEDGLKEIADTNFSPIALRFGTVYGLSPRIRFDVVINMLCGLAITTKSITLNSDGQAWRPNLHIDDACEAFKCCVEWEYGMGKLMVLNVGNDGDNYKVVDIAKTVHKYVENSSLNYLDKNKKHSDDDLIKDRKIQDGVDTRSYKVSFDKIHNTLPNFSCKWTVEKGIVNLLNQFRDIKLDNNTFNRREFYRLQQIEFLHKTQKIDDDLYWVNDHE